MQDHNIESTVIVKPSDADAVGRLLLEVASARQLGRLYTADVLTAFKDLTFDQIEEISNALLAIGNDTDAIVAPSEYDAPSYSGPRFEVKMLDKDIPSFQVYDNLDRRYCDGVFDSSDTAETWAHVLSDTEGVPEAPVPEPFQVDALAAMNVAEVLRFLAATNAHVTDWPMLFRNQLRKLARWQAEDVASALEALSKNEDIMIVQREVEF